MKREGKAMYCTQIFLKEESDIRMEKKERFLPFLLRYE